MNLRPDTLSAPSRRAKGIPCSLYHELWATAPGRIVLTLNSYTPSCFQDLTVCTHSVCVCVCVCVRACVCVCVQTEINFLADLPQAVRLKSELKKHHCKILSILASHLVCSWNLKSCFQKRNAWTCRWVENISLSVIQWTVICVSPALCVSSNPFFSVLFPNSESCVERILQHSETQYRYLRA